MRALILGGTTEASQLAALLAEQMVADRRFSAILSYAGRTRSPRPPPIPYRVGGFGGSCGLTRWLRDQQITAIIDATHPYAVQISANAIKAARATGIPITSLVRSPWRRHPDDQWHEVATTAAAASAIGQTPRRVFLAVGRLELSAFAQAPQHHYLARTIDPIDGQIVPPRIHHIAQRGPFDVDAETSLLAAHAIEVMVCKNAGGTASYPKIVAARQLALPVVMVRRPRKPTTQPLLSATAAVDWLMTVNPQAAAAKPDHGHSARGV